MKKAQIIGLTVLVVAVAFQGMAFAKAISGKVASVDTAGSKLSVSYTDPATGMEMKQEISATAETTYSGVAALGDLKEGQEVAIEATEDAATGSLTATSITASEAVSEAPEEAVPAEVPAEAPAQ